MVTLVEQVMSADRDTALEMAIGIGQAIQQSTDLGRLTLGWIGAELNTKYAQDVIGTFAKSVNVPVKTLRDYIRTSRYWDYSEYRDVLERYPNLSYSHLRAAVGFGEDREAAIAHLDKWSDNMTTIEEALREIAILRGKPTPPAKLVDVEGTVLHIDPLAGTVLLALGDAAMQLQGHCRKRVYVVIREVDHV